MNINSSPDAIAKRIVELRKNFGESQQDLADAINCAQNNISKIENGSSQTLTNLIDIAKHYKVSLDYLCTGKEGKDLLDTLEKYIHYDIRNTSGIAESKCLIPHIGINNSLYKCLRQIALAKAHLEMPQKIKDIWIEAIIKEFTENTSSSDIDEFTRFIPVKEEVLTNPEIVKIVEEHIVG
jgi:transcriptional regulator with XRE-family HTH domain